jgi:hypothetical protein
VTGFLSLTLAWLLASDEPHRHTIHLERASTTAKATELQEQIKQFHDVTFDFMKVIDHPPADFSLTNLTIEPTVSSALLLHGKVHNRTEHSRNVSTDPRDDGDGCVRRLFDEFVEKTLFDVSRGPYRPLPITSCAVPAANVRITVANDGMNALLDRHLLYEWGEWDDELKTITPKCVDFTFLDLNSATTTSATFTIDGVTAPATNFLQACRAGRGTGYLMPRMAPCVIRGKKNRDLRSPR